MKYYPVLDSELSHINSTVLSTNIFMSLASGCAGTSLTLWLTVQTISRDELKRVASDFGVAAISYGWGVSAGLSAMFLILGIRSYWEKRGLIQRIKRESRQTQVKGDPGKLTP